MTNSLNDITSCISTELKVFENELSSCLIEKGNDSLNAILSYTFDMKGKRVRPILSFLSAGALGKISKQTMRGALIVELLHTASLLHDDVLDNSTKRRNKQTINALWGNRLAILAGDYIYGKALSLIQTQEDFNLMPVYAKIAMDLPIGEISELKATDDIDVSLSTYLKVIYGKTASLIEASVLTGMLSCGKNVEFENQVKEFGKNLGMAFQIKDDILDYDTNTGKPKGIDIKEKKITLPLIYYLEEAKKEDKQEIIDFLYSEDKTEEKVNYFLDKIIQSQAIQKTKNKLMEHNQKALNALEVFPNNDFTKALKLLVQYLTIREL